MPNHNLETNKTDGAYDDPKKNPDNFKRWEHDNIQEYKESVYDKISSLLISKFSEIEKYIDGDGIEALQKTYKDGSLVTGKSESDMLVVYESDTEANTDDIKIESALLSWLDFGDVNQLTLEIVPMILDSDGGEDQVGALPPPNLILKMPGKFNFNMNEVLGTLDFSDISLTDNVSQFMGVKKLKTSINRSKLKEYVDIEFSELTPDTFTHLLEKYNRFKKDIPFYRYRTDDFFSEYSNANIPIEYRIEKFFEEFERIRLNIQPGQLLDISSTESKNEINLFGYGTMTYLLHKARMSMDDGGVPEWSSNQVLGFQVAINGLNVDSSSLVTDRDYWRDLYNSTLNQGIFGTSEGPDTIYQTDEVIPDGYVKLSDYITEEGYSEQTGDTTLDLEDVKKTILDGLPIYGCTDSDASNYNSTASTNDGSCAFVFGCTSTTALNYNSSATKDDDSCQYPSYTGCTNQQASNYNSTATQDDGTCVYTMGCKEPSAVNYNSNAIEEDGSCVYILGCMNSTATNYNPQAQEDDGSCVYILGCMTPSAENYNALAQEDDGSCTYTQGCTDPEAVNYNSVAVQDDGFCEYESWTGCTNPNAQNYNPSALQDDGSCVVPNGCTYPIAWNYDSDALADDGSCLCHDIPKCSDALYGAEVEKNIDSCTCTYPTISVAWSRKGEGNCHNYHGLLNKYADCECWCESSNTDIPVEHYANVGDCSKLGVDDGTLCNKQCDTKCAGLTTQWDTTPN